MNAGWQVESRSDQESRPPQPALRRPCRLVAAVLGLVVVASTAPSRADWPDVPEGTKPFLEIEFARPHGIPLHLDLVVPPSDAPVPLIIWVHGGGWYEGDRGDPPTFPLLYRGYAVASVDYRLSGMAHFPAQIYDLKAAIRFLRANAKSFHIDPDRFGVWGESAGGHLAALLGTTSARGQLEGSEGVTGVSSRVQAVADWYGPTDLTRLNVGRLKDGMSNEEVDGIVAGLLGGLARKDRRRAARANPITYVTKNAPPFFIMHGDEDEVVPLYQSKLLVRALRRAGVPVRFKVLKGAGHADEVFYSPRQLDRIADFFDEYLKDAD